MADLRATFLRFLRIRCFLGVAGVLGHRGFTIVLRNGEKSTVGTKIIADPEKSFQKLISEKLLIFVARLALFGIN